MKLAIALTVALVALILLGMNRPAVELCDEALLDPYFWPAAYEHGCWSDGLLPARARYALWIPPQPDRRINRPHSSALNWTSYLRARDLAMAQGSDTIAAFYGAKGWGAETFSKTGGLDCRSLPVQVLFVTATGSGSGSLNDVAENYVSDDSFTFIIFKTGGEGQGTVVINNSCLYIAAQTAPGGGYQQTKSAGSAVFTVFYKTSLRQHIAIRYLKIRSAESASCTHSTFNFEGGQFLIADHVSIEYTCDSFFTNSPLTGWDSLTNTTLQHSLLCGGLPSNGTGMELTYNETDPIMDRVTVAWNYTCEYEHRAPRFAIEDTLGIQEKFRAEYISNLDYNWWGSRPGSSQAAEGDFIRNLVVTGPGVRSPTQTSFLRYVDVDQATGHPLDSLGTIYMSGNTNCSSTTPGTGERCDGTQYWDYDLMHVWGTWEVPLPSEYRRGTPNPQPLFPVVPIDSAMWLLDSIPPLVGASQTLTCGGKWQYKRDVLDSLMVSYVLDDTGHAARPSSRSVYGGYPSLSVGSACSDQDNDGMPDDFEVAMGAADSTSLTVGGDCGSNGYLNIEEYVNGGLSEPGVFAWTDNSDNETGFIVSRWQSGVGWAVVDTVGPNVENYTVSDWAVGDSLQVVAFNIDGQSAATKATVTCP